MATDQPTAARLQLGARLRALRQAADVTGSLAGAAISASHSKISRMESGHQAARPKDIRALARLYRVGDAEQDELLELGRLAGQRGWWDDYSDNLPEHVQHHLSLEAAAEGIDVCDLVSVPALLQTSTYCRALCAAGGQARTWRAGLNATTLTHRRALMDGHARPKVWAMIGRQALHRPPGGDYRILLRQIEHLLTAVRSERTPVTIQLVPGGAPAQLGTAGPFSLLRYSEPDLPDIILLEQLTSTAILERRSDVDRYFELFTMVGVEALPPEESVRQLEEIRQMLAESLGEGT